MSGIFIPRIKDYTIPKKHRIYGLAGTVIPRAKPRRVAPVIKRDTMKGKTITADLSWASDDYKEAVANKHKQGKMKEHKAIDAIEETLSNTLQDGEKAIAIVKDKTGHCYFTTTIIEKTELKSMLMDMVKSI